MNNILSFNDGWSFAEFPLDTPVSEMLASDTLKPVEVPHDWMIWHVKDLYRDCIGFYRKSFFIQAEKDRTYIIRFEGIYMDSEIFLNGKHIFSWKYGYSTFDVDITGHLKDGENVICVKCTYQSPNTRWYSGAGIYRKVSLIDYGPVYIPLDETYVSMEKENDAFTLTIDTEVVAGVPGEYSVRHFLIDMDGKKAGFAGSLPAEASSLPDTPLLSSLPENAKGKVLSSRHSLRIASPRLWDVDDSYYYTLCTEVFDENSSLVDHTYTRVGFKTLEFDRDRGFFLNGRSLKINGVCMHHDLGALGSAMNRTALKRQLVMMREMGVNAIRTSHNMPSTELLDLCDDMGFLVYDEAFDMWENHKTDHDYASFFKEWYKKDVASWIRRDRNRPCLFLWGIGNEISDTAEEKGVRIATDLCNELRLHDPRHNAFTAIASNWMSTEWARKVADVVELPGYNYGEHFYDDHHRDHPEWRIFGSETGSTVQSRGVYHFPLSVRLLTHQDGQCSSLGNCTTNWGARDIDYLLQMHRDREFAWGQFIWTGWDYIGEPTPFDAMGCKNSYFGQVDTAGFKKDTFYHYQAEWTDVSKAPMVHLLPYWDFNEGQKIDVIAYSNAPYVELFFNGHSQGRQFIDHEHGEHMRGHWILEYTKGELEVKATLSDGTVVATDSVRSFSDPVALVAEPDKETLTADREDLVFISVSSVDEKGTFVANARNRVKVTVEGPGRLMGLDNGDSTDYDEYKGTSRKMFSGRMMAIIGATDKTGDIRVKFESEGLTPVEVNLTAKKDPRLDFQYGQSVIPSTKDEECHDIPIRKIELTAAGPRTLTPECTETIVKYRILPENATYDRIEFKALTANDVEANFAKIVPDISDVSEISGAACSVSGASGSVKVCALGDGDFRLTAYAYNAGEPGSGDSDPAISCPIAPHPEVVSELEYTVSGLGKALRNPYNMVPGCEYADTHDNEGAKLSFEGGVFLTGNKRAYATFDNLDFGPEGSDEIILPLFSFSNEIPVEILEGDIETGTSVFTGTYEAKSRYNVYQENTFKLNKKIRGINTITLIFDVESNFSLKGFKFI